METVVFAARALNGRSAKNPCTLVRYDIVLKSEVSTYPQGIVVERSRNLDSINAVPRQRADYDLAGSYAKVSLMVLITLMLCIGWWVDRTIQKQVIDNTAINAALYAQSFVAPELQALGNRAHLSDEEVGHLELLLTATPLGQKIRSLKIWTPDGRLLYHPQAEMIGQRFEPTASLLRAASGQVAAEFDEVAAGQEDAEEAKLNMALLEIYTPIKLQGQGHTVAIAEFYQDANALAERLGEARHQAWLVVIVCMVVAYGLLYGVVWRGSSIIHDQGRALRAQISLLSELLQRNESLSGQLRRAMNSSTENNEKLLSRLGADLHDGPAQYLGLALLRLDALSASVSEASSETIRELRKALQDSLTELRNIAKGLTLPNLQTMSVQEIIGSAVKAHRHRTGSEVAVRTDLGDTDSSPAMPVKITLFRAIQEGLNNAYRHAGGVGQQVTVNTDGRQLSIAIADRGQGFDLETSQKDGDRLGLRGLRERIKGLGGQLSVDSRVGDGTVVHVTLPLVEDE